MSNESMKKVFVTKLTDTDTTDKEGIGVIRFEGSRVFKYVTYNSGTGGVAAVANNMTAYHGDNAVVLDSAADVTSDYTDGTIGAGVLQAAIANGSYGWIQIKGVATLGTSLTAGADGNALTIVGAADGTLDVSALVTDYICAAAVDASADIVLLDCPW